MALVPNLRGAQAALAAGVHKLTMPVSASAAHSLANVRKTREQMIDEVRAHRRAAPTSARPTVAARSRHLHRLRLHASRASCRRRRDADGRAGGGAPAPTNAACPTPPAWPTRRRCGACSRACARRSASKPAPRTCTTRAAWAWPTAWPPRRGRAHLRRLARRPGRLPVRAGRVGQHRHRRPGVHVRGHGRAHRHRPRAADRGARTRCRPGCPASRSTA